MRNVAHDKEMKKEQREKYKRSLSLGTYEVGRCLSKIFPRFHINFRHRNLEKKKVVFVYSMLLVPILNWLVFWLYVNLDAITMAFRNIDFANGGVEYWTLNNFKEIYRMFTEKKVNTDMMHYASNTMKYWLIGTLWGIPHSILLTYAFHKKMRGYKKFRIILYLPSIICAVAMAGIFASSIMSNGLFGYILRQLGMERIPSWFGEAEYANGALMFYKFFFGFMGSYIVFSGAMANIDAEITDAAYVDGVTMWQELRYIIIPMMWPTLGVTIISSFSGIFGASGPILLFTQHLERTFTLGYWIFDQVRIYQSYYIPATLGLCFTLVAFPIALLVRRIVDNMYTTE